MQSSITLVGTLLRDYSIYIYINYIGRCNFLFLFLSLSLLFPTFYFLLPRLPPSHSLSVLSPSLPHSLPPSFPPSHPQLLSVVVRSAYYATKLSTPSAPDSSLTVQGYESLLMGKTLCSMRIWGTVGNKLQAEEGIKRLHLKFKVLKKSAGFVPILKCKSIVKNVVIGNGRTWLSTPNEDC